MPWNFSATVANYLNSYRRAAKSRERDLEREEAKFDRLDNIKEIRSQRTINGDIEIDELLKQIAITYKSILPLDMDYVVDNLEQLIVFKKPENFDNKKNFTTSERMIVSTQFNDDIIKLKTIKNDAESHLSYLKNICDSFGELLPGFEIDFVSRICGDNEEASQLFSNTIVKLRGLVNSIIYTPDNKSEDYEKHNYLKEEIAARKRDAISEVIDGVQYKDAVLMQNNFWISSFKEYEKKRNKKTTDIDTIKELAFEKQKKNDKINGIYIKYSKKQ